MKLIEKKCPNCGASLEFSETDKSCKCSYCHRAFEIERNENSSGGDLNQQYQLKEIKNASKLFLFFFIPFFIILFGFVCVIFFHVFQSFSTFDNSFNNFQVTNGQSESSNNLYSDVSELTNSDYEDIDFDANLEISNGEGKNYYSIDGDKKREKVYVAFKEGSDYIIAIYRVNYYKFPNKEIRSTVYVPMVYENINKNQFIDKFANHKIKATEYYFDAEQISYTYGYGSIEEVYNNVVKPLADDGYVITEK